MNKMIYEGKAKKVYATEDPNICIVSYKDDATAFNGQKKGTILGKGAVNNRVTNHLMKMLEKNGVPTHFVRQLTDTDTAVRRVSIIPLEVIVRNIAAGSMAKRLGVEEGQALKTTVLEFSYKNDDLGDPLINDYHALALGFATAEEIDIIKDLAFKINTLLSDFLLDIGVILVDIKLEFGKTSEGRIVLADEISPDTCRFWDRETRRKLDKDRFRQDLGDVEDAYTEILRRLIGE